MSSDKQFLVATASIQRHHLKLNCTRQSFV